MTVRWRVEKMEDKPNGRCRKWRVCIRLDERYANGQHKYRKERFEGTYSDAVAEAERLADAYERREAVAPTRWTFRAYAAHWNDAKLAAGSIQQSTHGKNVWLLALFSRFFGGTPLNEVSAEMIECAYAKLRNGDSPSGRQLTGTTLKSAHAVGHSMMQRAVDTGIVPRNPFALAMTPRADTKEKRALRLADEVELAISLDPTEPHHLALLLMLEAGLRRGEACALQWDDIEGNRMTVRRSMLPDGSTKPPKNGKPRSIPVSAFLREAIEKRRAVLEADCAKYNTEVPPYVLGYWDGSSVTTDAMRHWWSRNRSSLGMDGWTMHELRHSYCSNLAEAGVHPKVMQQLMGHSTAELAMRVYTHVNDAQLDDAAEALEKAKFRK